LVLSLNLVIYFYIKP